MVGHPAGFRRRPPVHTLQNQRKRQHPTRRLRIFRPRSRQPKLARRHVFPLYLNRHRTLHLATAMIQIFIQKGILHES
ncbi:MAG: hypothetical protein ACK5MQ_07835 [Pikeienuella sp.]